MADSIFTSVGAAGNPKSVSPQPSILAECVLFPFYDYIVLHWFPKRWVPNVITLVGVGMTLLSSFLLLSSMPPGTVFHPGRAEWRPHSLVLADHATGYTSPLYPTAVQPVLSFLSPRVFMFVCGLLNLCYCVADNTDGRLARRDRKFSPYGEYLDHGLDCVSSLMSASLVFCAMGGSLANMSVAVGLIALVTVLSHTLHYEANIFIWGNRIATVDEAMIFFALAMWIPLVVPSVNTLLLPGWALSLVGAVAGPAARAAVGHMKFIDLLLCLYGITQAETIAHILFLRCRTLVRLPTLALLGTVALLWAMLRPHNEHVTAYMKAHKGATAVPGYTLGRLTYPAVWTITMAFTASIIVHILIAAKCAGARCADCLPLAAVVFVCLTFVNCPVGAMLLAVAAHAVQVLCNIRHIVAVKAEAAAVAAETSPKPRR